MFCKNCGANLPEGVNVCPNCGAAAKQPQTINKTFVLNHINTILAAVSVVLMFLPMFVLNGKEMGYSNKLSVSGLEVAKGITFTDFSETSRNVFAWMMILLPVFAILTNYIKQLFPLKKVTLFAAPLACAVCLFLAKSTFSSAVNISVTTALGFWLYLVVSLFWLLVGYLQYKNMPLTKDSVVNLLNQKNSKFTNFH